MSGWYVVNTRPRQEARAELNLRRQGFRAWLPRLLQSRAQAQRIVTLSAPVFPNYLFVELDPTSEAWSRINNSFGVRRLLTQGDRPARVPTAFVESLRASVDPRGDVALLAAEALAAGQRVRIVSGPLFGQVGTLLEMPSADRVRILLSVLGVETPATIDRRAVAPAA